jgi:hypothetical protein
VTIGAIFGLAVLNLLFLVAGTGVLGSLRGRPSVADLLRLGGVAYLLGVTVVLFLLVLEMLVGIRFGLASVVVTSLLVALVGGVTSVARGEATEATGTTWIASWGSVSVCAAALGLASLIVYLEAAFRSARLSGLFEYDAMSFWVPKAKAIYFFGGFDRQLFTTLPNASYPPFLPTLEAASFAFMHAADTVTLHLTFWFLLAGFFWAIVGLLALRVEPVVFWPLLLLLAVTPVVVDRGVQALADMFLDCLLAVAAVLLALWFEDRHGWQLVSAFILLAGAANTKREGLLLALCLLAAAALAIRRRATTILLTVLFVAVFVTTIPWRIWLNEHSVATQGPSAGYFGSFGQLARAWPSLHLTLTVLFGLHWWSILPWLVPLAVAAAILNGQLRLGLFAILYLGIGIVACSWVTMAFPDMAITTNDALNPIVRLSGGVVIPLAAFLPLVLRGQSLNVAEVPVPA